MGVETLLDDIKSECVTVVSNRNQIDIITVICFL